MQSVLIELEHKLGDKIELESNFEDKLSASRLNFSPSLAIIVKFTVVPILGVLSIQIFPPISSTRFLQIESPSPEPPYFLVVEAFYFHLWFKYNLDQKNIYIHSCKY